MTLQQKLKKNIQKNTTTADELLGEEGVRPSTITILFHMVSLYFKHFILFI